MKKLFYLIPPSVLSFLTVLFYYPSLRYPFLFDDLPRIVNNYEIRATSAKKLFFANLRWVSDLINYFTFRNWKLNPFAYRTINLLIHILGGILIFALVLLICKQVKKKPFFKKNALLLSTITSGLFLLHPVQTQTATYITQIRLEGLVLLFTFTTIIAFTQATHTKNPWVKTLLYLLCAVFVVFAAGTKEIIVVLPVLMMLVDWFFLAEGDFKVFLKRLPIHLTLAFILYYSLFKLGTPVEPMKALSLNIKVKNNRGNVLTSKPQELILPIKYLISQFRVILHYITMFFFPFGLSFDYGWKIPASFWSPASIFPFIMLISILLTGLILFIRNTTNFISFCIAWFFTVVLPRSTIIPSTELVCDYKTYLASFAPLFLISFGLTYVLVRVKDKVFIKKTWVRPLQITAPLILLTTLGFASMQRNKVWSSRLTFWGDVIAKTEGHVSARAYNNYAVGLILARQPKKALEYYKKSILTDKTYAEPIINLALFFQNRNNDKMAFQCYRRAILLKEAHPEMYNNLGLLHLRRKNYAKAEKSFLAALRLRKHYPKAIFNLKRLREAKKRAGTRS